MKTLFLILFLLPLTMAFSGEFEKKLETFNSITVQGNFEVYLKKGEAPAAKVVNTDADLLDEQIIFDQKGADLKITTKGNSLRKLSLKVYVTYTSLVELTTRNAGWIECKETLDGEKVTISCATDGVIHAKLACKSIEAAVLTGGTIRLSGAADIADYKVNAGGFISGKDVVAKEVVARINSGGDISCHGTEKMELRTTIGTIKYIFDGDKANFKEKATLGGEIKAFN